MTSFAKTHHKSFLTFIALLCCLGMYTVAFTADIFDESESASMSLDERIKALEADISVDTKALSKEDLQEKRKRFQSSISGQLDASTLEKEVQELKHEIIELNKELAILEQDILTPVSSQVALFLSIDNGNFFRLDGIKVEINGNVVEHHLYTKQEISALQKGAIQRVHTANLAPGNHEIVIIMSGFSIDGRDVKKAASYKFYKPNSKKYIELAITDNVEEQKAEFKFNEWQ